MSRLGRLQQQGGDGIGHARPETENLETWKSGILTSVGALDKQTNKVWSRAYSRHSPAPLACRECTVLRRRHMENDGQVLRNFEFKRILRNSYAIMVQPPIHYHNIYNIQRGIGWPFLTQIKFSQITHNLRNFHNCLIGCVCLFIYTRFCLYKSDKLEVVKCLLQIVIWRA
jgi:hypothetical protein